MRVTNLSVNTNSGACHPLIAVSWSMVSAGCVEKRSAARRPTICPGSTAGTFSGRERSASLHVLGICRLYLSRAGALEIAQGLDGLMLSQNSTGDGSNGRIFLDKKGPSAG